MVNTIESPHSLLTTQMGVSRSGQNFKDAIVDRKQRHIESTTSEIIDDDLTLTAFLVKTIRNCSGCRFVHDSKHVGQYSRRIGRSAKLT